MGNNKNKQQLKIAKYFKNIKFKNYRFKFRHLITVVALSMVGIFLGYIFKTGYLDSGTPQFGDRCLDLPIEVDTKALVSFNDSFVEEHERLNSLDINKQCRQFKITLRMNDVTNIEDAQNHVIAYAHALDNTIGLDKAEEEPFSQLLAINGYELNFLVLSDAVDFPLFAGKIAGHDDFSWRSSAVTNQSVVDDLTKTEETNVEGQGEETE